jgi:hypothetical protein
VLRGAGADKTIIRDTGTRHGATISFDGGSDRVRRQHPQRHRQVRPRRRATLTMTSVTGYAVGDTVIVHRPSTQQWIHDMGWTC